MLLRTDTTTAPGGFEVLALGLGNIFNSTRVAPNFQATTGWDGGGRAQLPLAEVNAGLPFDATAYSPCQRVRLVPTYSLGPTTYAKVIRAALGFGPATAVYHAQKSGLVAFEDERTGFWYRLP